MKWSAKPPVLELTLSALLHEILAEHSDDPLIFPVHAQAETGRGYAPLACAPQCTLRCRPPIGALP